MNNRFRKFILFFTLIILIVSFLIKYGFPFFRKLSEEKHDKQRINDISLVNSFLEEKTPKKLDWTDKSSKKIYISLPSVFEDCHNLSLPTLFNDWQYSCQPEETFRKTDGSGWLPVNFTDGSIGNPPFNILPIDPSNSHEFYYSFIPADGWAILAPMESKKYLHELAQQDGGTDPLRFELGNNFSSWADADNLESYWKFDEKKDTTAKDSSGHNNDGTIYNAEWVNEASCLTGKCLSFNGRTSIVKAKSTQISGINKTLSVLVWVKLSSYNSPGTTSGIVSRSSDNLIYLAIKDKKLAVYLNGLENPGYYMSSTDIPLDQWVHVAMTYSESSGKLKLYVNKILDKTFDLNGKLVNSKDDFEIGQWSGSGLSVNGLIKRVMVYGRVLDNEEVGRIYDATK